MRRCKNCGAFEGTTDECLRIEATGPVFGKHAWQILQEDKRPQAAPGPEHWATYTGHRAPSQPRPQVPADYLTANTKPPGQLLDGRTDTGRTLTSQMLLAQAPRPSTPYIRAEVQRAMGLRRMGWHEQIIQECAPLCRGVPKMLHERLPWHVRSRRATNVNHLK